MAEEKGKILKLLKLDKLFETLMGYIETQIEIVKLDIKEQAEKSIQDLIQALVILLIGGIFLVFFSMAIAIGLNILLESKILAHPKHMPGRPAILAACKANSASRRAAKTSQGDPALTG